MHFGNGLREQNLATAAGHLQGDQTQDTAKDKVLLVIGSWHHGQLTGNDSSLGAP
jgi:hypothetical protein